MTVAILFYLFIFLSRKTYNIGHFNKGLWGLVQFWREAQVAFLGTAVLAHFTELKVPAKQFGGKKKEKKF